MILVSPQLSQTAASIDNRVPTPSSVASAETNSQQPGPEVPLLEMKAEIKTEDTEPDAGEPKGEPGAAVGAFHGRGGPAAHSSIPGHLGEAPLSALCVPAYVSLPHSVMVQVRKRLQTDWLFIFRY